MPGWTGTVPVEGKRELSWPDSGKWQATLCPGPISRRGGSFSAQSASDRGHLVRNLQPDGGSVGEGRSPCKGAGPAWAVGSGDGIAASNAAL